MPFLFRFSHSWLKVAFQLIIKIHRSAIMVFRFADIQSDDALYPIYLMKT